MEMKKEWEKPKLIVLIRGKPEESVLLFCKTLGYAGENQPQGIIFQCGLFAEPMPCEPLVTS